MIKNITSTLLTFHVNAATSFIFGLALMFATHNIYAWSIVYANDKNGNATYGKISALQSAIAKGKDVKVGMVDTNGTSYMLCEQLFSNSDGSIACMNTNHISTRSSFPGHDFGFFDDAYHWFVLVNTAGQIDMSRWSVGEHTNRGHTQDTIELKWFIN